ncbi:MAG: tRNA (N6-threonylcarbamoyladenosine(37)-N6)-methyltransferase TrmO [FCB group bacterium]|nr:tRNA (N6-threonylcarbamoyladenosine(37)-N6)-methyltransferase TrmO [FCB group bacterium]
MTEKNITYHQIGLINSPHKKVKGMPIQPSSAAGVKGEIELFPEYSDGLKDLDGFSHIIVIYDFHKSEGFSLQPKPFLDDKIHGVFATRAPQRPNSIGISVLRLNEINGNKLFVENIDILDETPLLDIKPFVSNFDAVDQEKVGWLSNNLDEVEFKKSDERFE